MIVVTGGLGFIGFNLIKKLNSNNITNIVIVDDLQNKHNNHKNIKKIKFLNLYTFSFHNPFSKSIIKAKIPNTTTTAEEMPYALYLN